MNIQNIKYFCTKFLCVLIICTLFQTNINALYETSTTDNYLEVLYDNYNGLPTPEANDIIQTSDGSIWIASYSSLIRYDGQEFTTFSDSHGITSILCLFIDSQDRLWIGTNNDGIVLYENNAFTFFKDDDVPSFSVRSIAELSDGTLLVGTALGLYSISQDMSIEVNTDERLQDSFILDLKSFGENQVVGITKVGDIFILDGTEISTFIPISDWEYDLPLCILPFESESGPYFIVGTNNDYLLLMNPLENFSSFSYQSISTGSLKYINDLFFDSKNQLWIGSDSGIAYYDTSNTLHVLDYLTNNQAIENIIEDFEGNYWFASGKVGVLKISPSMFKNVSSNLNNVVQFNAVEILDGFIYVASSSGIDIINQADLSAVENELTEKYRGSYVRCVQKDDDGNLWFSTYTDDALVKYTPSTEEITAFNAEKGLDYTRIRSTMTASDGKIWVATGNGIYVVENDEVIAHFTGSDGLQSLEILTLSEGFTGKVYAGTDGAGVYVIENMEITQKIDREAGLLSDIVLRTETDPFNGGTWIVTGNSLSFYDPQTQELKNITDFPYKNNFDFIFYEDTVVILCSNGIYFVDYESLISDDVELSYMHINHLNGLYSTAVANSFSKIEDGFLYFCGYQNLLSYNLNIESNTDTTAYIPPVEMPNILVNSNIIYPLSDNYFLLPSNSNYIEFPVFIPTYSLIDYSISYSLIGYDEFMHNVNYTNYADPTYTNLLGGKYEFLVQLIDTHTGKIVNENTFIIEKEYAFTESPIFKFFSFIITIAISVLVVFFIFKNREKQSKAREQELNEMFFDTVEVLSHAIDAKDRYTNGHSKRVAFYTKTLAIALNFSDDDVNTAYMTGLLHDVGKISIPDSVLNKTGRLTNEEFEIMKTHGENGADILLNIRAKPELVIGAKYHHERFDGNGYSTKLKGYDIPIIGRIICVADAFDAMHSSRVYRKKLELDVVLAELERNKGTQFDPEIVDVFIDIIKSGQIDEQLAQFTKEDEEME